MAGGEKGGGGSVEEKRVARVGEELVALFIKAKRRTRGWRGRATWSSWRRHCSIWSETPTCKGCRRREGLPLR